MASFNQVVLLGNLVREVELRHVGANNTAVSEITLAVNDRVKKGNEWVDEATFVDVTLWGRHAETASEYLSKGSPVMIEGKLKQQSWEKDGQKRSKHHVVCETLVLVGPRKQADRITPEPARPVRGEILPATVGAANDAEIPF